MRDFKLPLVKGKGVTLSLSKGDALNKPQRK